MTDGQSFYLVLSLFYLIECVKFAPIGSLALVCLNGRFGTSSLREPFTTAWGLKKSVFLAPLLPWPYDMYFLSGSKPAPGSAKRITLVSGIKRHQRVLQRSTQLLRGLAIVNLLNFFVILPFVYIRTYEEKPILICLAYCYVLLLATSVHYHALHKRLLPREKGDRLKTTLYTATLPWHAPRCVDEIYLKSSRRWSMLPALAANTANPQVLAKLQYYWRAAHFQPQAPYPREALSDVLAQVELSPAQWLAPPSALESPQYCPCCHSGYEEQATHCSDCEGVALVQE